MFTGLKAEKLLKILIFSGLLILLTIIFSQKIEFTASDLGRHLENGKIVWHNGQVLFKNFYSYTEPDNPFINHHWFSGVIYYLVYFLGGFKLLSFLNILVIIAAFSLAFKLAREKAGFYLPAILSLPVIFLLSERIEVRPEIFSYFLIILTWFILERASAKRNYRLLWWLVPLFVFWVNIHIYFFIGLALVGFKMLAEFITNFLATSSGDFSSRLKATWPALFPWFRVLAFVFIACLFNPNFIHGLLYPFNIFQNYGYEIAENKSVFYIGHLMLNYNIFLFKALFVLLVLSFSASFFFFKKINYFELLLGIFFSFLGLIAIRNISLFGLAALILISSNLNWLISFWKNNLLSSYHEIISLFKPYLAGLVLSVIIFGIFYLWLDARKMNNFIRNSLGWGLNRGSSDSIKFFQDNKLSGPIFNNYDIGSALIFWLYPSEKVFVDNRPEAYSKDFFNNIYRPMQLDYAKWQEYNDKYQFKTIYFSHTDFTPWAQTFLGKTLDSNWGLVYFDRSTVILLNKKKYDSETLTKLVYTDKAIRERLRDLAANSDLKAKYNLASFAVLIRQPDLAEEIYREIIFDNPDSSLALSSLGGVYANQATRASLSEALIYFKRGLAAGYKLPGLYNQIALVYWQLGDFKQAEMAWHSALKLERKNVSALYYLEQLRQLRLQGRIK